MHQHSKTTDHHNLIDIIPEMQGWFNISISISIIIIVIGL
jgi:hypothetical protein